MKKKRTIANVMLTFNIGYMAANYALDYYDKWIEYGERGYTSYEKQILKQLGIVVVRGYM